MTFVEFSAAASRPEILRRLTRRAFDERDVVARSCSSTSRPGGRGFESPRSLFMNRLS